MNWQQHEYDAIPGTYVFDGKRSHSGYNLNRMAFSFNQKANRDEFSADMDAYCRKYQLSDEQREAVLAGDFLTLMRLGGNVYYLAKIAVFHGLTVQDAGAAFHGISTDEFKQMLLNNAAGFEEKLNQEGGFWHG
ncbi:protocatechuate 3,4-dioxygenase [Oceanobacter antarcticus]|jgi:protocatechuate 4,5-dioxygenase alpha chain|uniref:Protocatechuate 3,4-dioxygenase n=1 Tax=Oceanobacter antarcticus TaxID=3133425 RepID=A0ABW8NNE3_9GAMM|tara:strand:+ start:1038 stop:1439 length:402 start_codon:yes stop_codon:yes gene_type:complete